MYMSIKKRRNIVAKIRKQWIIQKSYAKFTSAYLNVPDICLTMAFWNRQIDFESW